MLGRQQRTLDEFGDDADEVARHEARAHGLKCFRGPRIAENGDAAQHRAFGRSQEIVAPGDSRFDADVTLAAALIRESDLIVQALRDAVERKEVGSRCDELDRQRHAVEFARDDPDAPRGREREPHVRRDLGRAFEEEPHGVVAGERLGRRRCRGRNVERAQRDDAFARHGLTSPARRQQTRFRAL